MGSVEIFKTNIKGERTVTYLAMEMNSLFPCCKVTVDLNDRDKVLRVESEKGKVKADKVIELLNKRGFHCEILNY